MKRFLVAICFLLFPKVGLAEGLDPPILQTLFWGQFFDPSLPKDSYDFNVGIAGFAESFWKIELFCTKFNSKGRWCEAKIRVLNCSADSGSNFFGYELSTDGDDLFVELEKNVLTIKFKTNRLNQAWRTLVLNGKFGKQRGIEMFIPNEVISVAKRMLNLTESVKIKGEVFDNEKLGFRILNKGKASCTFNFDHDPL